MTNDSENRRGRNGSIRGLELITTLLFGALLAAFFAPAFSLAQTLPAPGGKVFCPLSGKFQPVKAPAKTKVREPFDYLCASAKTKDFLYGEIVVKNPFRVFSLDAESIEKLAFEILAGDKTALKKFPYAPDAPLETSFRRMTSIVAVKNYNEQKTIWKYAVIAFAPALAPRPPTADPNLFSPINPTYQSTELSRHIAPRAPPFVS